MQASHCMPVSTHQVPQQFFLHRMPGLWSLVSTLAISVESEACIWVSWGLLIGSGHVLLGQNTSTCVIHACTCTFLWLWTVFLWTACVYSFCQWSGKYLPCLLILCAPFIWSDSEDTPFLDTTIVASFRVFPLCSQITSALTIALAGWSGKILVASKDSKGMSLTASLLECKTIV